MLLTFLAFIFVFGLIVFVHEFGHYISARFFGVRVEEFAFGFPPKLWAKKIKETIYAINALPIGGYVRLYGEDGEASKDEDNLVNKKPWQKAIIFAAGVFMNFVLAFFLLTGFYAIGGETIITGMAEHKGVINNQKVFIVDVVKDSPAARQDLQVGDQITRVQGESIYMSEKLFVAVQEAKANGSGKVDVTVLRDGTEYQKELTTYTDKIESNGKTVEVERIGIAMETKGGIKTSLLRAPVVAAEELFRLSKLTIVGFGDFFKKLFTEFKISEDVGGPVAIVQLTGAAARMGFSALIQFIIVISITLGVLNILPFPALDGGHIFFLLVEKLIRREIPRNVKDAINKLGFALLLVLVAVVTFKDLTRSGIFGLFKGE